MKVFVLIASCIFASVVHAENWIAIPATDDHGLISLTYDRDSVSKDSVNGIIRFNATWAYSQGQIVTPPQGLPWVYNIMWIDQLINCKTHMATDGLEIQYSGNVVVSKSSTELSPWRPILPGSVGETEMQAMCALLGTRT